MYRCMLKVIKTKMWHHGHCYDTNFTNATFIDEIIQMYWYSKHYTKTIVSPSAFLVMLINKFCNTCTTTELWSGISMSWYNKVVNE